MRLKDLRWTGLSALAAGLVAQPALAQDESASAEEIIVTGSRITTNGYDAPTPVTVATIDQLLASAPTNIPDALNKLPQFLGSSSPKNNRHGVVATPEHGNLINLRGVGSSRTLILMDGQRVPPTTFLGAVDVNVLPQLLVKRVDVVTGGASSVYGSDAVTGVVNFVIDDNFVGIKGIAQYGLASRGDDQNYRIGMALGHKFGERVHLLLSAEQFESGELAQNSRKAGQFGAFGVGATGVGTPGSATNPLIPTENIRLPSTTSGGLITSGPFAGNSFFAPQVYRPIATGTATGTPGMFVGGDGFVYPSERTLIAPLKTRQAFARLSVQLTDTIDFYAQGILSDSQTSYRTLANGLGFNSTIYSGNAFLPPALQQQLTQAGAASFNFTKVYQAEGLSLTTEKTDFHSVSAHLGGDLGGVKWAVDYSYGRSQHSPRSSNVMDARRLTTAIDAVDTGTFAGGAPSGTIVCRVTLTNPDLYPGCVPFNPFGEGASSQPARNYVTATNPAYVARITQHTIAGNISGSLFDNWAGPVGFAVGAEYRTQKLSLASNSDPAIARPITGLRGPITTATPLFLGTYNVGVAEGQSNVKEFYGEVSLPIARDIAFIRSLDLTGAIRYTNYSTSGSVSTWKLGGTWSPVDGLLFRATWSKDIRAPTLYDLFAGQQTSLTSPFDPHTNTTGPIITVTGGNPNLTPEIGKTLTFGVVARPRFLPGLAISLDYYKLRISNAITLLTAAQIPVLCEQSNGTSPVCDLITRPFPFSDRSAANRFTEIRPQNINAAFLNTSGLDLDASYVTSFLGGKLTSRLYLNYVFNFTRQNTDVSPVIEYAGLAGISPITRESRAEGIPKLRASLSLAYETGPWKISVQETMIGKVKYGDVTQIWAPEVKPIGAVFYTDLTTSFRMPSSRPMELFATVNNLFDRDAPFVASGTSAPGVVPNTLMNLYDVEGRRFTVGIRMGF